MERKRVLFVCIHNSARSQMAEELLRKIVGDKFEIESAGIEPGQLNPLVIDVLREDGIDIFGKATKAVKDLFAAGKRYDFVITVCDEGNAESCPIFPGGVKIHWSFTDPSRFQGTKQEKLDKIRKVKEEIKIKISEWGNGIISQEGIVNLGK